MVKMDFVVVFVEKLDTWCQSSFYGDRY